MITRDPRFEDSSGSLNRGLFAKSYSFIKDIQQERVQELKTELRNAKNIGDEDARYKIKELLGDEKGLMNQQKREKEEW